MMNGPIGNLMYVCSEIWKQIGVAQRISILLVALLGLGALGSVLYFGTQPNWHVVYADLPSEKAAEVYEMANDEKIPVKLTASGHTVKVPFKYVSDLRARVSRSNLDVERQGVGLELFDNLKLGMTEMQQRVGLQRAIQGELERMVAGMDGVDSARVMLALPERRVFNREAEEQPEASVFLEQARNRSLSRAQIQSITRLVAGAVPELSPEDVTITDDRGNLLAHGNSKAGGAGGMDKFIELRQRMEDNLREKAESVLRPIVGADKVVAVVNLDLDASEEEITKESYDSDQAVVIHERILSEDNARTDHKETRAAGTASNLVSVEDPEETSGPADETKESSKTVENQYVVPKTVRRTKRQVPIVKNLSVAVTIARKEDGQPRDAATLDQFRSLVMSAVGGIANDAAQRQDVVTVMEGVFEEVPGVESLPPKTPVDRVLDIVAQASPMQVARPLMAVFFLFVLYRMFGGMLRRTQMDNMDLGGTGLQGDAAHSLSGAGADGEQRNVGETGTHPLDRIRARVEQDPAQVAASLESWMRTPSQ